MNDIISDAIINKKNKRKTLLNEIMRHLTNKKEKKKRRIK